MTGSISRGSKSTFNDDLHDETSCSFIRKKSNCNCEGEITELLFHRNEIFQNIKNQIQDKVRNALKKKKRHFLAREELNSQVVIVDEHQCIMPTYSTAMTMLLTVAWHDIPGQSGKQILNAIFNKHLADYNKKTTFIDYGQTSNCSDNSLNNNISFADCRSGSGHLQRETSSC